MNRGQIKTVEPQPGDDEQRAASRIALMLRVGKLCLPQGEFLCVVRDASASGLKVKLFHELPAHQACTIELGTGDSYDLEPVWQEDGHAGYRFRSGDADLSGLIDESTPFPRRHLRIRLDHPVTLLAGEEPRSAVLRDISQHGVLIDHPERLPVGLNLRLEGPGMPALEGRIRWRMGRSHGVVLQRSFRLDELALLTLALQTNSGVAQSPVR